MKRFFVLTILLSTSIVVGQKLSNEEKRNDFEQIASLVKSKYGPYQLKKSTLKIDVEGETKAFDADLLVTKYAALAKNTTTNLEFYYLLNQFVAEFKDSHFSARLNTTRYSTLGFMTERVQGKVLIDQVSPLILSPSEFPYRKGDEVITFAGKPINDVVEELSKYISAGNPNTALHIASMLVGHRPSATLPPQRGKVEIEILSQLTGKTEKVELDWVQTGESIAELEAGSASDIGGSSSKNDLFELSVADAYSYLPKTEMSYRCSGRTRIAKPANAVTLMDDPFVAYYHPTPKGNVGYLRIPHYAWPSDEQETRFKQYERVIDKLEKNTVGLIIDQDHNCGGSVTYLEKMVSLFAEKPFKGLEFQFLSTRSEYLSFKSRVNSEMATTLEGEGVLEMIKVIRESYLKTTNRLTPKTTFHGTQMLMPNPVHYTKPIVMLIDEMSGSGGDAFPAMLQGMGRAKLMGKRTMGAGGHVMQGEPLNFSGNNVNITKSLFFHPNGDPIENKGANPDAGYEYEITANDFLKGYKEYQTAYLNKLAALIATPTPAPAAVDFAIAK